MEQYLCIGALTQSRVTQPVIHPRVSAKDHCVEESLTFLGVVYCMNYGNNNE